MLLGLLAFLGGALTIVSPCILPVLPFVFARSEHAFVRSTLPLLVGMAITFAAIATLAAVGGGWAVQLNAYGRYLALVLLAGFGAALLSKRIATWLSQPFVGLGNRMLQAGGARGASIYQSLILGVATGLLWAPCAGPILGLILTGAAINGPSVQTTLLLFAYALGAVTSLAVASLAGGRVFSLLKRSLGAGEWVRRALGTAVILAVVAIGLGLDTGVLTRWSFGGTNRLEQSLMSALPGAGNGQQMAMSGGAAMTGGAAMNGSMAMSGGTAMTAGAAMSGSMAMSGGAAMNGTMGMTGAMSGAMSGAMTGPAGGPPIEGQLPPLRGASSWLNSQPLTPQALRGKVVLIDFWTYSCINCLRALPYVRAWHERYRDHGLEVIGVHAPEFAFEKDEKNVRRAVAELSVNYPVALDNNYAIWRAFNNQYWPAHYFIDSAGRIRGHHFGEGNYEESEQTIRSLLIEAGNRDLPDPVKVASVGVQIAADEAHVKSPETYLGYERAENFASPGGFARDVEKNYATPAVLRLNQWALTGRWTVADERAVLNESGGKITFRFQARDLHLVLGPGVDGKPLRFRVTLDGQPPAGARGVDIDAAGTGTVREQQLYQLIRQNEEIRERTFSIEFLDGGVNVYAFTFG